MLNKSSPCQEADRSWWTRNQREFLGSYHLSFIFKVATKPLDNWVGAPSSYNLKIRVWWLTLLKALLTSKSTPEVKIDVSPYNTIWNTGKVNSHVSPNNTMYCHVCPYTAMYCHVSSHITIYTHVFSYINIYYHVLPLITIYSTIILQGNPGYEVISNQRVA